MHSQQLDYFCKVAECGSFSRAAIAIGINQSAVSRHVRNLEESLKAQLFYRNGRGVLLTEVGKRLFDRASRALREIAAAEDEVLNSGKDVVSSVVIGMTPTVSRVLVQPMARQLLSAFPAIKLRFVEGFSGTLVEWLDAGRIDIAILYSGRGSAGMNPELLVKERLCLVASAKEPKLRMKTPAAFLEKVPLILPSRTQGLRQLIEGIALEHNLKLNVIIEADSLGSLLALVKAGLGYTILPAAPIREELARRDVQASLLVQPEVTRTLILATPANRPKVRGLGQIAKVVKKEMKRFGEV
jgi:LysR family transcriptional regulator, nitrogen assimilation regulatory protein